MTVKMSTDFVVANLCKNKQKWRQNSKKSHNQHKINCKMAKICTTIPHFSIKLRLMIKFVYDLYNLQCPVISIQTKQISSILLFANSDKNKLEHFICNGILKEKGTGGTYYGIQERLFMGRRDSSQSV